MVIEVIPQDSKQGLSQEAERKIVVLFNPWCKGRSIGLHQLLTVSLSYLCVQKTRCIYQGTLRQMNTS